VSGGHAFTDLSFLSSSPWDGVFLDGSVFFGPLRTGRRSFRDTCLIEVLSLG